MCNFVQRCGVRDPGRDRHDADLVAVGKRVTLRQATTPRIDSDPVLIAQVDNVPAQVLRRQAFDVGHVHSNPPCSHKCAPFPAAACADRDGVIPGREPPRWVGINQAIMMPRQILESVGDYDGIVKIIHAGCPLAHTL
jgi:hypothetical protein